MFLSLYGFTFNALVFVNHVDMIDITIDFFKCIYTV